MGAHFRSAGVVLVLSAASAFGAFAGCSSDSAQSSGDDAALPPLRERDAAAATGATPGPRPDATSVDARAPGEGGAATTDAGKGAAPDGGPAGPEDAGVAPPPHDADTTSILGTLSGSCGTLGAALAESGPSLVTNELTFVEGESYVKTALSPDGQRMFDTPNAGGSSLESEVMSLEVLYFCDGARLVKTEEEIAYEPKEGKKADGLFTLYGQKVGVSVTRTYTPGGMRDEVVKALLETKLRGLVAARAHVAPSDAWTRELLHVLAVGPAGVEAVKRVWPTISAADKGTAVVVVTGATGGGFIFCDPDPALGSECPAPN